MLDFLIMYEVKTRELENILLIGNELKRRGYSVEYLSFEHVNPKKYLDNKKVIGKYFNNVNVVLMPSLYHDKEVYELVYYVCGQCRNIVNLRWEQSLSVKVENDLDNYAYPHGSAKTAYHVCWGKASYRSLAASGIAEDKLLLTGPVQMDFLFPQARGYYLSKEELYQKYHFPQDRKTVLYISSFAIANRTQRQIELEEKSAGGVNLWRDKIQFTADSQKQTLDWIEALLKKDSCTFIYRPHPVENANEDLKQLQEKYPHFRVISDYSIKQWILCCDFISTWMSTAIAEAFFAQKPCLIVRPLPFAPENECTIYQGAKIVDNLEDYLARIMDVNEVSVSEDVIRRYYDVTGIPSHVRLCDELEKILASDQHFAWNQEQMKAVDSRRWAHILQNILIWGYIPLLKLLGAVRKKTGLSYGKKINNRVDSYQKASPNIVKNIASPEEIEQISARLAQFFGNDA